MRKNIAYSFVSSFGMSQMLDAFNREDAHQWLERTSELHGDYLACCSCHNARLRIFYEKDRYALDIFYETTGSFLTHDEWTALIELIRTKIFRIVAAREVEETDGFD